MGYELLLHLLITATDLYSAEYSVPRQIQVHYNKNISNNVSLPVLLGEKWIEKVQAIKRNKYVINT